MKYPFRINIWIFGLILALVCMAIGKFSEMILFGYEPYFLAGLFSAVVSVFMFVIDIIFYAKAKGFRVFLAKLFQIAGIASGVVLLYPSVQQSLAAWFPGYEWYFMGFYAVALVILLMFFFSRPWESDRQKRLDDILKSKDSKKIKDELRKK